MFYTVNEIIKGRDELEQFAILQKQMKNENFALEYGAKRNKNTQDAIINAMALDKNNNELVPRMNLAQKLHDMKLDQNNDGWVSGQSGSDPDSLGASIVDVVNRILRDHPGHPATAPFLSDLLSTANDFYRVAGGSPSIRKATVNRNAVTGPGVHVGSGQRASKVGDQSFAVERAKAQFQAERKKAILSTYRQDVASLDRQPGMDVTVNNSLVHLKGNKLEKLKAFHRRLQAKELQAR